MCLALIDIHSREKCNAKKLLQTLGLFVIQREKIYGDRKVSGKSSMRWPNESTNLLE